MKRNPQNTISVNNSHAAILSKAVINNRKHSCNRIKLSHLNVQSVRNRNHLIQVRALNILALSDRDMAKFFHD